jgi:hypothetical protein
VPRVLVTNDHGEVFWSERVTAADFEAEHFGRCLADRLGWAAADAEGPSPANVGSVRPMPTPRPNRPLEETITFRMAIA